MFIFLKLKETTNFFFIFVSFVLFFFCLLLYFYNKKLQERVSKLELETKKILEQKVKKRENIDSISLDKISLKEDKKPLKKNDCSYCEKQVKSKHVSNIFVNQKNIKKIIYKNIVIINGVDMISKNCDNQIKENFNSEKKTYNSVFPLSEVQSKVSRIESDYYINDERVNFDLSDFVKKSERIVPGVKEDNIQRDYLKEVSDKMADKLKPQTIELTDYEKEQEEHAVISYKELLSLKDKFEMRNDENNTQFIDELKNFRNIL